ncbi:pirin family protein [Paenibacillus chondroitinus]|uniref:Pirin family protein n=1 Tax=Paenibacillus chondroitinus TaxID=59842 RepID=A0ABU6DLM0_9BACL|nr:MULTISPECIES: pirin family protein [Paenibacillus]MCY9661459.1 pirin family protein [Paenibacillus anseongense]MEB4798679.1 pirin family protein [Paenibacillus chondroitinus]
MHIQIFSADQQGVGAFDGGKFIEQRAISFPREKTAVDRVGPLFYWAWGHATDVAEIGMHPHKAFEIVTYVIQGLVEHRDSLGSLETVSDGGAQVIQAGSGVSHAEAFRTAGTEGMQIWFEPHLSQSVKKPATYNQYEHEQFPVVQQDGVTVKSVIGGEAPIQLDTDANMFDWNLEPGATFTYSLHSNRQVAFLVIRGQGSSESAADGKGAQAISHKDFVVVQNDKQADELLLLKADDEQGLRIIAIEVPVDPGYALYHK